MPITIIEQNPKFTKKVEEENKLSISEMFCDTLQGEGPSAGVISTFMRLQGCTLKCTWCDTLEVWPNGNEYTFDEIFQMFENYDLINKFKQGQHLVLTGGSPLKQQDQLLLFLRYFLNLYGFIPYIELENEAVLMVKPELQFYIKQYNNSPKLANSGMKERARIKPEVLKQLNNINGLSYFKFVVEREEDWEEIERDFIKPGYIYKSKIILMPQGQTQVELNRTRETAADMAIKHGVRFSDRMHVTIWDKKTGV